jgi:2-oxoglutarate/2-oxoacid ferredoxin oxidoreductase subunit alpha
VPAPIEARAEGATLGIIGIGGCDLAIREAIELLAGEGVVVDYLRIRAFPFAAPVQRFLDDHEVCFVVEQNRDAQLRSLLTIECSTEPSALRSILVYGGFPLSARHVVDGVMSQLKE